MVYAHIKPWGGAVGKIPQSRIVAKRKRREKRKKHLIEWASGVLMVPPEEKSVGGSAVQGFNRFTSAMTQVAGVFKPVDKRPGFDRSAWGNTDGKATTGEHS